MKQNNQSLKQKLEKSEAEKESLKNKIKELENSDEFDDVEEKEQAIADAKSDLTYYKNRSNELKHELSSSREDGLKELAGDALLSKKETDAFFAFAKLSKYAELDPDEVFALYKSSKDGNLQIDQQALNKKANVSLIGENKKSNGTVDVSKMTPEQRSAYLSKEIEAGNIQL
ncbi:MAG: hypothetical protein LBG59_02305 [Candidatus Peribacteria bacterium]|jgi:predicted RNase H-like nuclease (RuvC/YqgF family)|nr:hypothetical protein [Candidatus Peribacteria bacterium]